MNPKIMGGGMKVGRCEKESFVVIGKEGTTTDGDDFIQRLWADADAHFDEIQPLTKTDADGNLAGIWGVMSDFSHSFRPWEDFSKGLYLAGVECAEDAEAPAGWTKWIVPGYEFVYVEHDDDISFADGIQYLKDHDLPLAGAAHDFTDPATGRQYMFFPIRRLPA